ncbi:sodium-dependent glucose transporter 1 [Cyprinodon tularosa]|uniref:sodium-dependent glucose transporter 1 n=1 Tax=Cyprinodon tularosa TaxID=77115 RepID=UPI0018E1E169|nr:sodium-dependent glucose transporter 1 [Cyprinodon tularosa]
MSSGRESVAKKKHVRFANMEEEEQEEDTLFDQRKEAGRGLKSALKLAKRSMKAGGESRVRVSAGGSGACGRWMVTLALCGSFLGLGMGISVVGPTFQDLAANVHKNISNISYIITGRAVGYIGGSLIGGILFECMNPHILLGISMLLTALGMYAIPFCKQVLFLTGIMSVVGMAMGALDTGGNVLILNTWGENSGPHMQALHFSFAAGAFASPIIAKLLFGHDGNGSSPLTPTSPPAAMSRITLKSMWAYIVIGSVLLFISFLFLLLYACGSKSRDKAQAASERPCVAKHHSVLVALLFFFFFAYVGAEVAYGTFIFTFATDYAHMPEAHAAGLNSLFWGTFAATRGAAIFFAACLYPGTMILLCLLGSVLSSLLLCLFTNNHAVLWVGTGLYGASMATTFPSGISWLEQYTTVTGKTAAAFVVGAALGEMVLPSLVGFLLGVFPKQPLLMYLSIITATFTSILFPVMYKVASAPGGQSRKPGIRGRSDADDSEYRQALLDSGADEEEEQQNEADQWNDADFEIIEMDDASSSNSPSKESSPADGGAVTATSESDGDLLQGDSQT